MKSICPQIDNSDRSPSGHWKHRKPGEYGPVEIIGLVLALECGYSSLAHERSRGANLNEALKLVLLEELVLLFDPAH